MTFEPIRRPRQRPRRQRFRRQPRPVRQPGDIAIRRQRRGDGEKQNRDRTNRQTSDACIRNQRLRKYCDLTIVALSVHHDHPPLSRPVNAGRELQLDVARLARPGDERDVAGELIQARAREAARRRRSNPARSAAARQSQCASAAISDATRSCPGREHIISVPVSAIAQSQLVMPTSQASSSRRCSSARKHAEPGHGRAASIARRPATRPGPADRAVHAASKRPIRACLGQQLLSCSPAAARSPTTNASPPTAFTSSANRSHRSPPAPT